MASEIQIQAQIYQTATSKWPQIRKCFFAVPNGGSRNKIEGMQLKASGTVKGIPDMILIWNGKAYGFEVKTDSGVLSDDQIKVHRAWAMQKVEVFVVREVESCLGLIKSIVE